jgi:alkanesulfonate monooxygenase SsuD/methylene tetrahydromethanopterin reductase-like flavin-dependent oxidoreductase (luciferase family)
LIAAGDLPASGDRAGALGDAWTPFLLPRSSLHEFVRQLRAGRHHDAGRDGAPATAVWPGIPVDLARDPERARAVAAWWITFYLTRMGPLYPSLLRRLGYADDVDAVVAAAGAGVPPTTTRRLVEELTLCGTPDRAHEILDGWYAAGAELPCLVLPPSADLDELDAILVDLAPSPG